MQCARLWSRKTSLGLLMGICLQHIDSFFAPRTMQIADFIIGLSGHLRLHFHCVWQAISIQTKEAYKGKRHFLLSWENEEDIHGLVKLWKRCMFLMLRNKYHKQNGAEAQSAHDYSSSTSRFSWFK